MKKIVVKLGTSTLTQGTKTLSRAYMLKLVEQVVLLKKMGKEVILVSSGAIAAGREVLNHPKIDKSLPSKQMFASIGQVKLMHIWSELFALFNIHVGQILLTRADISDRKRYLNARDTLECLLKHNIVPIINENDTVATQEIRVGDNDTLAALVGNLISADTVILLTDQEGLYTKDPRFHKDAKLIPLVEHINADVFALAGGSGSSLGTGGMTTKIQAAQIAAQSGTKTIIASSARDNVLIDLAEGKQIGTTFLEAISARESRKRWILSDKRQGTIHVDAGAADKLLHHGASLLACGILKTEGEYERGSTLEIFANGKPIGVGISNYSHFDIEKLLGKHSADIEEILGYTYGPEVIHRTNMTRVKMELV